jgi:DNA modification methylase
MNLLYYGDNLDVLRRHVADESIDLVYLDPPFNSAQDYNVLFTERDGTRAAAQIKAFGNTWTWDQASARSFQEVVEAAGAVSQAMQAFRTFIGESDMLAYLSMMAPRLLELRRVLKETVGFVVRRPMHRCRAVRSCHIARVPSTGGERAFILPIVLGGFSKAIAACAPSESATDSRCLPAASSR